MIILRLALSVLFIASALASAPEGQRWWSHVEYLASDRMQGRDTGSEGYHRAAEYVAARFAKAGLKPAGSSGYFQSVRFEVRRLVEKDSSVGLVTSSGVATPLQLGNDVILGVRGDVPAAGITAPAVFVGYGLKIPEANYDDLAGQNLQGKIAVYLRGAPKSLAGPLAAHYQSLERRWKALKTAG